MSNPPTDNELLAKATSGDQVALHQLLLEHYGSLTKRITAKIPVQFQGAVSAEDVIQQTFLQVLRNIHQFEPRSDRSFHVWVRTIAENRLKDTIRHLTYEKRIGKPRRDCETTFADESSVRDLVELLSAGSHSPSRSAARHETVAAVQKAIDALPDDYRQAVELRLFSGKSLAETATIMQRTPRAVQGLVDRAKKKMRAALGRLSLYE